MPGPIRSPPPPCPGGVNSLVTRVIQVQQLTLQAALERDADLAFQALLLDPLVVIPPDQAYKMFREMLEKTKSALSGWDLERGGRGR